MNEDTADFDPSLRAMMKQYGFITDEPKVEEKRRNKVPKFKVGDKVTVDYFLEGEIIYIRSHFGPKHI